MLQLTFVSESTVAYIATARYSSKSRLGCPVQRALMTRSDTEEFDEFDDSYAYGDHGNEHYEDSESDAVDPSPQNAERPASSESKGAGKGEQSAVTLGEQNTGPASSAGQNRASVFRPDIWAARTSVAGPIWAPPSDQCHSVRAPWTPQMGQTLLPYRMMDDIVWVR